MVLKAQASPALTTFYVYLTSGCNCACRHCWFVPEKTAHTATNELLQPDTLRHAIVQGLPLGLRSIKWTGGEPSLHPRIADFLMLQKEFGLDGLVETNGILVDEVLAGQFREAGVRRVSVSLDGACAATHDEIRGVAGGFQQTLQGIAALVGAGYRPELILTLQQRNRAELDDYYILAQRLGAGSVKLNILQPVLRGAALLEEGQHLEIAEILELAAVLDHRQDNHKALPVQLDLPMAFRPLQKMVAGEQIGVCNILHVMGILPRGDYALCGIGQHVDELAMGPILEQPLAELWQNHSVLTRLRNGLPRLLQGVCNTCLMRSACKGSCVAANYQLANDLFAPYWFCQQAADLGRFPAQRRAPAEPGA